MNKVKLMDAIVAYRVAVKLERKVMKAVNLLVEDVSESAYTSELDTIKGFIDKTIREELDLDNKIEDIFDCEAIMMDIMNVLENDEKSKSEDVLNKILEIVKENTK